MTSMMQNPQGDGDGGRIFVMQAMQSPSECYLSSESLENDRNSTTSSTESPNGTVTHRKDHEFIPTRTKTINASRPAADPSKFTKVPSNPLLVSAHQQLKQAEEIKKKKESTKLKVKRGDEEPDWQSNLSSWKSRRRKQSEEALQRMAEVKALEDAQKTGQPRKISIGKKLSSLLYTSGEDLDWSEMGLDKDDEQSDEERLQDDSDLNEGKSPQDGDAAECPLAAREGDTSSNKDAKPQPEWTSSKVQNWMEVIRQDAPRKAASQPLVTYSQRNFESVPNGGSQQQQQQQPQVRRKSSELSSTMKTRLEAFTDAGGGGGGGGGSAKSVENAPKQTVVAPIEPDQQFHQKLMAFRRISEGNLEQRQEEMLKPKPPLSISSLLGGQQNVSQSNARLLDSPPLTPEDSPRNNRNNEDYENDTLEDVDQLLDDALEESYRSVLEDFSVSVTGDAVESDPKVFTDIDFVGKDGKVPPLEKPPPPPPSTGKGNSTNDVGEDIDQQEREIIASLEIEEREHNRYISEKMKRLPTPSSSANYDSGISSSSKPPSRQESDLPLSDHSSSTSVSKSNRTRDNLRNENDVKNTYNSAQGSAVTTTKQKRQPNEQRAYDQHWVIQEAEQRRLGEMQQQQEERQDSAKRISSPSNQSTGSSIAGDGQRQNMATTENGPVYENSMYVNQQQPRQLHVAAREQQHTRIIPSASNNSAQPHVGMVSAPAHNENVYANLCSQSSGQLVGSTTSRDGRIPGPRVPPRSQNDPVQPGSNGERVLSVSGRKRCSHCKEELGRGAAMIIESLRLYYHLRCFQCCVCQIQLGNGVSGTDVRVRNNKLHCQNCYSNDEGLKFSKV